MKQYPVPSPTEDNGGGGGGNVTPTPPTWWEKNMFKVFVVGIIAIVGIIIAIALLT